MELTFSFIGILLFNFFIINVMLKRIQFLLSIPIDQNSL